MNSYKVVGYGSLISHHSLQETIPDRKFVAILVKGYKRIFNVMAKNHTDVLNIEKKTGHFFNGVLFTVNEDELRKIKRRERPQYEFKKSWAYEFETNKKISLALLAIDLHTSIDHHNHLPNWLYLKSCREAAYAISQKFGQMWDQTTYLNNGEQLSSWIKRNSNYDGL